MSHMKTLNKKGPKIDSCGTPNNISPHKHLLLHFVFYLRGNYVLMLKNFCYVLILKKLSN